MSIESGKNFRLRNPWYDLYHNAKRRCEDPKQKSYKHCGGLGIKFLITQHEVETLFNWYGGHFMAIPSLNRIDAKGHYEWRNCRIIEKAINERLPHDEKLNKVWTD